MIRKVKTALPGARDGEDRTWIVMLDCGHETQVRGRVGRRPRRGDSVVCTACDAQQAAVEESAAE